MGFWNKAKTAERPGTWDGTEKYGPVKLASVDFRDGQQSVIATRMRTEDMLPILEQMDNFGYESIEMWGGATFDSCIRYLNEDPWERLKAFKRVCKKTPLRKGEAMNELLNIPCGTVRVTDGIITYVGENRISHEKPGYKVLDARGNVLLPGFVDSHTHLVFGGFRPDEFIWRLNGDSYMSIMERGGGIINTVRATREASFEELKHKAEWFLDTMSRMGVTTVEGKSGYGLDRDTELKQLSVMQAINECPDRKVDIATTFLGAHALPEEYKGRSDAYIDFLINEMLPMIHQKQLAENCDIFCEKGVFTVEQSRKLLKAAQALGFGTKLHADEIVSFGGAELAGELKALSADHLLQASDEGIKALAQNNVVATLLPLTAFTLKEPYARGRKMIDSGCAVALATDLNPGSCFSGSIPLTFALACIYMKLTVAEAITAITLNGAAALGRADRIGSIEAGKQGDFVLLGTDNPHILPYYTGMNAVKLTIKGGRILHSN